MRDEEHGLFTSLVDRPGDAFPQVLAYALAGLAIVLVAHLALTRFSRRSFPCRHRWSVWQRLGYAPLMFSVGVLGGTAFGAVLSGDSLSGWLLLGHMVGAGIFLAALPLVAVTWCTVYQGPLRQPRDEQGAHPPPRTLTDSLPQVMFWLLLASGLVVSLTMLLSMLPLFDTDLLERLLDLHRYSGLLAAVAAAIHLYGVLLQRGIRQDGPRNRDA